MQTIKKHTYKNGFYSPGKPYDEYLRSEKAPVQYRGFQIYHRIQSQKKTGNCFDVVTDGVCVGMYAGIEGAKNFIDKCIALNLDDKLEAAKKIKTYLSI